MNKLVADGKIRRVGVSNFTLALMEQAVASCETPLATNQVHYNVLHREYVDNGVLAYCQEQGIIVTAYSPVKDGVLNDATVKVIAESHNATPAQVALQWLIQQPHVITIPKSSNKQRQQENWDAAGIELPAADIQRLDGLG